MGCRHQGLGPGARQPTGKDVQAGGRGRGRDPEEEGDGHGNPAVEAVGPLRPDTRGNARELSGSKRLRLGQGANGLAGRAYGQVGLSLLVLPAGRIGRKTHHDFPFLRSC